MYVISGFGATATPRPPVIEIFKSFGLAFGEFMKTCDQKPQGVSKVSSYESMDQMGYPGWQFAYYAEPEGVTYTHIKAADGSDGFWLYPHKSIPCGQNSKATGGVVQSSRPFMVKELQRALNEKFLAGDPAPLLKVDGNPGPLTCAAAFKAQWQWLQVDAAELVPDLFSALNLPADYHMHLKDVCAEQYQGQLVQGHPTPQVPIQTTTLAEVPLAVAPVASGRGKAVVAVVIGAVLLAGLILWPSETRWLAPRKKSKKRRSRKR